MADSLAEALAAFQAELPPIGKDKAVLVEKKTGGAYGYKYATLGSITNITVPLLGKHGLSFTSRPTIGANGFVLAYTLRHASGESDDGEYPLPDPIRTTPQMIGSAITYARRYALCAATGVAPDDEEDDDGQAAETAPYEPEVRADGSATEAEQARMNRGPVPGVERLGSTPPDDPFYDQPRTDAMPREELPGTASADQLRKMHGLFVNLGIDRDQRDERLALTREITGRDVQSASALSFVEARALNDVLEERLKKPEPEPGPRQRPRRPSKGDLAARDHLDRLKASLPLSPPERLADDWHDILGWLCGEPWEGTPGQVADATAALEDVLQRAGEDPEKAVTDLWTAYQAREHAG